MAFKKIFLSLQNLAKPHLEIQKRETRQMIYMAKSHKPFAKNLSQFSTGHIFNNSAVTIS